MTKRSLADSLSERVARLHRKSQESRWFRILGARGTLAVALGTALSVGGLSDTMAGAHFLVQKDPDFVRVVRVDRGHAGIVAKLDDGFAANSVFKLSRILPDSLVTRRNALFDDAWIDQQPPIDPSAQLDDGFAANSVFKLSRILPDSLVTRRNALFDDAWIDQQPPIDP